MHSLKLALLICLPIVLVLPGTASAAWEAGQNFIGPSLGLSFLGSTPQFGANFEHPIETESLGTLGVGAVFRYWSYTEEWDYWGLYGTALGEWHYRNVLLGAQGNYHISMDDDRFDPWLGLILAYDVASVSWDGPGGDYNSPSAGGMWLSINGGLRYFVSEKLALVGRFGFGSLSYGALDLGVDFAF